MYLLSLDYAKYPDNALMVVDDLTLLYALQGIKDKLELETSMLVVRRAGLEARGKGRAQWEKSKLKQLIIEDIEKELHVGLNSMA